MRRRIDTEVPARRRAGGRLMHTTALAVVLAVTAGAARGQTIVESTTNVTTPEVLPPDAGDVTLTQVATRGVVVWEQLDLAEGRTVTFDQPGPDAVTLNRQSSDFANPFNIEGTINAPGSVWFSNPNGVLIGQTATLDVGGLMATTATIQNEVDWISETADAAFAFGEADPAGAIRFDDPSGDTPTVASGGYVVIVAPQIEGEAEDVAAVGTIEVGGVAVGPGAAFVNADSFTMSDTDGLISYEVDHATASEFRLSGLAISGPTAVLIDGGGLAAATAGIVNVGSIAQASTVEINGDDVTLSGAVGATDDIVIRAETDVLVSDGVTVASSGGSVEVAADFAFVGGDGADGEGDIALADGATVGGVFGGETGVDLRGVNVTIGGAASGAGDIFVATRDQNDGEIGGRLEVTGADAGGGFSLDAGDDVVLLAADDIVLAGTARAGGAMIAYADVAERELEQLFVDDQLPDDADTGEVGLEPGFADGIADGDGVEGAGIGVGDGTGAVIDPSDVPGDGATLEAADFVDVRGANVAVGGAGATGAGEGQSGDVWLIARNGDDADEGNVAVDGAGLVAEASAGFALDAAGDIVLLAGDDITVVGDARAGGAALAYADVTTEELDRLFTASRLPADAAFFNGDISEFELDAAFAGAVVDEDGAGAVEGAGAVFVAGERVDLRGLDVAVAGAASSDDSVYLITRDGTGEGGGGAISVTGADAAQGFSLAAAEDVVVVAADDIGLADGPAGGAGAEGDVVLVADVTPVEIVQLIGDLLLPADARPTVDGDAVGAVRGTGATLVAGEEIVVLASEIEIGGAAVVGAAEGTGDLWLVTRAVVSQDPVGGGSLAVDAGDAAGAALDAPGDVVMLAGDDIRLAGEVRAGGGAIAYADARAGAIERLIVDAGVALDDLDTFTAVAAAIPDGDGSGSVVDPSGEAGGGALFEAGTDVDVRGIGVAIAGAEAAGDVFVIARQETLDVGVGGLGAGDDLVALAADDVRIAGPFDAGGDAVFLADVDAAALQVLADAEPEPLLPADLATLDDVVVAALTDDDGIGAVGSADVPLTGPTSAGGDLVARGGDVFAGALTAGGDLLLVARTGEVVIGGDQIADGRFDALAAGDVTATGGIAAPVVVVAADADPAATGTPAPAGWLGLAAPDRAGAVSLDGLVGGGTIDLYFAEDVDLAGSVEGVDVDGSNATVTLHPTAPESLFFLGDGDEPGPRLEAAGWAAIDTADGVLRVLADGTVELDAATLDVGSLAALLILADRVRIDDRVVFGADGASTPARIAVDLGEAGAPVDVVAGDTARGALVVEPESPALLDLTVHALEAVRLGTEGRQRAGDPGIEVGFVFGEAGSVRINPESPTQPATIRAFGDFGRFDPVFSVGGENLVAGSRVENGERLAFRAFAPSLEPGAFDPIENCFTGEPCPSTSSEEEAIQFLFELLEDVAPALVTQLPNLTLPDITIEEREAGEEDPVTNLGNELRWD